jgi:hypothetical protein
MRAPMPREAPVMNQTRGKVGVEVEVMKGSKGLRVKGWVGRWSEI